MSKPQTRRGGKYGDNHCTLIPLAAKLADLLIDETVIKRIYPDKIIASRGSSGPRKHVKIGSMSDGVMSLAVTEGSQQQTLRVHVSDMQAGKLLAAQLARNVHMTVSFQKT